MQQVNLLVNVEQVKDPDIPLRYASLSHVASLCIAFPMYGFEHSCGRSTASFPSGLCALNVVTLSAVGTIAGRLILKKHSTDPLATRRLLSEED